MLGLVHNGTTAVKTQDVIPNAARPTRFHLVLVSEELLASVATTIIKLGVSQYSKQCALTSINISYHCNPVTSAV